VDFISNFSKSRQIISSNENNSNSEDDWDEIRINNLLEVANEISFNGSDVDSICSSLDNLLTAARKANK
jgi:hypothetical protein